MPDAAGGLGRLLMSEEVRQEIELVEEQEAELQAMQQEIREEMRERMQSVFAGMRDLSREERRERMEGVRAEVELIRDDVEQRIGSVLMPHQLERLQQIELQQRLRSGGSRALMRGRVAEELGITPEQQEEMRAKASEVQATLQQKIDELRREAREEVLAVLTPEQRSRLEELTGPQFDMPRGEGRGRGGPGARREGGPGRPDRSSERPGVE
ncbi:MAG: hypothetical protein AAGG46_00280 [Planctomycetota bacterium]